MAIDEGYGWSWMRGTGGHDEGYRWSWMRGTGGHG